MAVTAKHSAGRTQPLSRFMSQIANENRKAMNKKKYDALKNNLDTTGAKFVRKGAEDDKPKVPEINRRAMGKERKTFPSSGIRGIKNNAYKQRRADYDRQQEASRQNRVSRSQSEIERAFDEAERKRRGK